jgi:hypothetical protein
MLSKEEIKDFLFQPENLERIKENMLVDNEKEQKRFSVAVAIIDFYEPDYRLAVHKKLRASSLNLSYYQFELEPCIISKYTKLSGKQAFYDALDNEEFHKDVVKKILDAITKL